MSETLQSIHSLSFLPDRTAAALPGSAHGWNRSNVKRYRVSTPVRETAQRNSCLKSPRHSRKADDMSQCDQPERGRFVCCTSTRCNPRRWVVPLYSLSRCVVYGVVTPLRPSRPCVPCPTSHVSLEETRRDAPVDAHPFRGFRTPDRETATPKFHCLSWEKRERERSERHPEQQRRHNACLAEWMVKDYSPLGNATRTLRGLVQSAGWVGASYYASMLRLCCFAHLLQGGGLVRDNDCCSQILLTRLQSIGRVDEMSHAADRPGLMPFARLTGNAAAAWL
jgi:hypothetical protein